MMKNLNSVIAVSALLCAGCGVNANSIASTELLEAPETDSSSAAERKITLIAGETEKSIMTFSVDNSTGDILRIESLVTTCGCVKADISTKTIRPGHAATLSLHFEPDTASQTVERIVFCKLRFDRGDDRTFQVSVITRPRLSIIDGSPQLGKIALNQTHKRKFRMRFLSREMLQVLPTNTSSSTELSIAIIANWALQSKKLDDLFVYESDLLIELTPTAQSQVGTATLGVNALLKDGRAFNEQVKMEWHTVTGWNITPKRIAVRHGGSAAVEPCVIHLKRIDGIKQQIAAVATGHPEIVVASGLVA